MVIQRGSNHHSPLLIAAGLSKDDSNQFWKDPLPADVVSRIKSAAKENDCISPVWANKAQDASRRYPKIYEIIRAANPHCLCLEYANANNYAGQVWLGFPHGKIETEKLPEANFLHQPLSPQAPTTRCTPHFHAPDPNLSAYNEWQYDIGHPNWPGIIAAATVEAINLGANGVWMDNAGQSGDFLIRRLVDGASAPKVAALNPRTGGTYTPARKLIDMLVIAQRVRERVLAKYPGWKAHGREIIVAPNIGAPLIDDGEWPIVDAYGGVQSEGGGWFADRKGPTAYTPESWRSQIAQVRRVIDSGRPWFYMAKKYEGAVAWPDRLNYTYASALMCAGRPEDRFYWRHGGEGTATFMSTDLGWAVEDSKQVADFVFARKFQRGLVIVNGGATSKTVVIGGANYSMPARSWKHVAGSYALPPVVPVPVPPPEPLPEPPPPSTGPIEPTEPTNPEDPSLPPPPLPEPEPAPTPEPTPTPVPEPVDRALVDAATLKIEAALVELKQAL